MKKLRGIEGACRVLASQQANILFYKRLPYQDQKLKSEVQSGALVYGFRRGTIPVAVPRQFIKTLLDRGWGDNETLFSFRLRNRRSQIKAAFNEALLGGVSLEEAFANQGITVRSDFVKAMLISSYGAYGELRVVDPQYGVENLSYFLLRETDFADSRVYNPNLGGLERLRHILSNENFDLIGMCPIVFENDVEVMAMVNELGENALKVVGGPAFYTTPPDVFLMSFPADVVIKGPGELKLANIAEKLFTNKERILDLLKEEKGLWVYENGQVTFTGKVPLSSLKLDPHSDDVPTKEPDIFHGTTYLGKRRKKVIVQGDHIGLKPIPIVITDHCRGRCAFCGCPKNLMRMNKQQRSTAVKGAVEKIKEEWNRKGQQEPYDAVQVLDNNFTTYRHVVEEFCHEVIRQGLAEIPKSCKGRVDEFCVTRDSSVPDLKLIKLMARAGFKRIYFGNESFSQDALDNMHKGITVEQNENVLSAVIEAGIRPGMNMIVFGGLNDGPEDVLYSVKRTLDYVEKGATANVSTSMGVSHWQRAIDIYPQRILFELWERPGMRAPIRMPDTIFTNPELEEFREKVERKQDDFLNFLRYQYPFQTFSTHTNALALFWAVAHMIGEDDIAENAEWLIDAHICEQSKNVYPYQKVPMPLLRKMRYAFVDGQYGEVIRNYNEYLHALADSNPEKFEDSNITPEELPIDPLKPVLDIPSLARDMSDVVRILESELGRPVRIRMAGYPATGKTMLRNQLIEQGITFSMVNLDQYRVVQQGGGDQVWQTDSRVEKYYDLTGVAEDLDTAPPDQRTLYEGTWVLSPEFNFGGQWDISLAFDLPTPVWRQSLWFRQILFRRKGLDALLPSKEQLALYDDTYRKYITKNLGDANLVIGAEGEIKARGRIADILKEMSISRFRTSVFIDQLRNFR